MATAKIKRHVETNRRIGQSNRLYLALETGAQESYWNPGLEGKESPVSYKTEGLASYKAEGVVGYGEPILSLSYETPLVRSEKQTDLLAVNRSQRSGVEKYTAGLIVEPILIIFYPEIAQNYFLKSLLSVEFVHSESSFYGRAEVSRDFAYLPADAVADLSNRTISGARLIRAGSSLSFRTNFRENQATISLLDIKQYSLRVGYYDFAWERPSDNNSNITLTDGGVVYPILYQTTYRTKGLTFLVKNEEPWTPFWNWDLGFQFGTDNQVNNAINLPLPQNESLAFFGCQVALWYNWYLNQGEEEHPSGFFLSFGASADIRDWRIDRKDSEGRTIGSQALDEERLMKLFAGVGWRF